MSPSPTAPVTIDRPLKQSRDEMGLTVEGIRRRRWLMPEDQSAASAAAKPATVTPLRGGAGRTRSSAKSRFNVLPAGQADEDPASS